MPQFAKAGDIHERFLAKYDFDINTDGFCQNSSRALGYGSSENYGGE